MLTITVNYDTTIPLSAQVYNRIVGEINSNHLHYGNKMPSPRIIAGVMGLDLQMVEESYRLLIENRIISRLKTKKYIVSSYRDNGMVKQIRVKNN